MVFVATVVNLGDPAMPGLHGTCTVMHIAEVPRPQTSLTQDANGRTGEPELYKRLQQDATSGGRFKGPEGRLDRP